MLDAYDLYLRALPHAFDNTLADNDEAIRLLSKALVLDPNYAVAMPTSPGVTSSVFSGAVSIPPIRPPR